MNKQERRGLLKGKIAEATREANPIKVSFEKHQEINLSFSSHSFKQNQGILSLTANVLEHYTG